MLLCNQFRVTVITTLYPTTAPIVSPTMQTSHPTIETITPTLAPSEAPSNNPSISPTKSPTAEPTNSPTVEPTLTPSKGPSVSPTQSPTTNPTKSPTVTPTKSPTIPTIIPTENPTKSPTILPTNDPTIPPTTLDAGLRGQNNENETKICSTNDATTMYNGIVNEGDIYGLQLKKELGSCNNVNEFSFEIEFDYIDYLNNGNLVYIITDDDKYFAIINEYYNINGYGGGYYISPQSNTKLLNFDNTITGPWLQNLARNNDISNWDRESNPMDQSNELPIKIKVDIDVIIGIIKVSLYKNGIKKLEYKYLDSFKIGNELSLYIQPLNNGNGFNIKCPKMTMNCPLNEPCFYNDPSIIDTGNGWLTYESEKPRILYKAVTKDGLINDDSLPVYLTHDLYSDTWNEFNKQCFDDYGTSLATIKTRKIQNLVIKSMIDNGCENAWFGLTDIKGPYNYKFINGDNININDFIGWSNKLSSVADPNSYTDTIGSNGYISYTKSNDNGCGLFHWGDECADAVHECGICFKIDTSEPTISPTRIPTITPTINPSTTPTITPTLNPSLSPTLTPSVSPTTTPTKSPTLTPTVTPTFNPTTSPTLTPSISPTTTPTTIPSLSPTLSPSLTPTVTPILNPTLFPTISPSLSPTTTPTKSPSLDGCDFAYEDYMWKCHGIIDTNSDGVGAKTNELNINGNAYGYLNTKSTANLIAPFISIIFILIVSNFIICIKLQNKSIIIYNKIDNNYSSNDEYTSESDINNNENRQML